MRREVESFLDKNMSRKDFLKHVGLLLLSVIGIGNIIKYISGTEYFSGITNQAKGYGANPYGGSVSMRNKNK